MTTTLTAITEAVVNGSVSRTGETLLVQIITPGWGSSGYYPEEALKAAAKGRVFPAGTHMYLDHPGLAEQADRPVRSVRDLAAVLQEDARWDSKAGALVAKARVLGPYQGPLMEMADDIGVSIRASAMAEYGTAEGRDGLIVRELVSSESVDFVTKAGRGGRILEVLESAQAAPVAAAVARGVEESTANATREALDKAVRAAFASEGTWTWVRDFDESTVWYAIEEQKTTTLYQDGYTLDVNEAAVLAGSPFQVRPVTSYVAVETTAPVVEHQPSVPVTPAGRTTPDQVSQEDHMAQIQVDEAHLASVTEAAGRVPELERQLSEATAGRTAAEQRASGAENRSAAIEAIAASGRTFTATERRGLLADLPVTEGGALDATAFQARLTEAIAEADAARGAGTVTGFGATQQAVTVDESAIDATIAALRGKGH